MKINKDIIKDLKNKKIIYLIVLITFVVIIAVLAFFVFKPEKEIEQPEVVEPIIEKTPEQLIMEQQTQELEELFQQIR